MTTFEGSVIIKVYEKSGGRCWYCGTKISVESRQEKVCKSTYAIDHFPDLPYFFFAFEDNGWIR